MIIHVGTCGFPVSRKKYFEKFTTIELQDTFYNKPDPDKLSRLREKAPNQFIFNMKAWQAITHPPTMPTWRRAKVKIPKDKANVYGFLRPTKENFEAWDVIVKAAKKIQARVIVVQLPSSFKCTKENVSNMKEFLSTIASKTEPIVGIEVRGDWRENEERLKEVLMEFKNIIHIVDPFKWNPVKIGDVTYFRLHGLGGREVNYKYKYTDDDLRKLRDIIRKFLSTSREVFVMFNNIYMYDDALRFKELLQQV